MTACADDHRVGPVDPFQAGDANTQPLGRIQVGDAVNRLPPLQREVLLSAYRLGWTTDRIAAELHTTESSVKALLHEALHALRRTSMDPTRRRG